MEQKLRDHEAGEKCGLAGVEPRFEPRDGDAVAFIVSANLARRNMTKGQRAMAYAFIYPEPEKGGRGKKSQNCCETQQFSKHRLSNARQVLKHSRPYAEQVLAGSMSLDEALLKVRQAQNKIEEVQNEVMDEEAKEAADRAEKLAELREKAPDLADLVPFVQGELRWPPAQ